MAFGEWEAKNWKSRQCQTVDRPDIVLRSAFPSGVRNYREIAVSFNTICQTGKKADFRPEGFLTRLMHRAIPEAA